MDEEILDEIEYISTQKGGQIAVLHDFLYTVERKHGEKVYWRCKDRTCQGRIHVVAGKVVSKSEHRHFGNRTSVLSIRAKEDIKKRAAESLDTPRQIIQHITATMPLQATSKLPNYLAHQRSIERKRKSRAIPLPRPNTLQEIVTANMPFQLSLRKKQFLLHDTGTDDQRRIIVFATEANIKYFMESDHWLADETFKISPSLFVQLYTIHAVAHGAVIPLVYALLPNKSAETYKRLFSIIHDKIIKLSGGVCAARGPKNMITDFESAAITSFKKVFKATVMQGCMFRFGQSMFRKIQELGLSSKYASDMNFHENCKMMLALAYVPVDGFLGPWTALQSMPNRAFETTSPLNQYFLDTYIGGEGAGRSTVRKSPLYPIAFWNTFQRVLDRVHRTTNSLEAWHNAMQKTVGCNHSAVDTFFGKLRHEQSFQEVALDRLTTDQPAKKARTKYRQVSERLEATIQISQ